jgi:hypothetical protein
LGARGIQVNLSFWGLDFCAESRSDAGGEVGGLLSKITRHELHSSTILGREEEEEEEEEEGEGEEKDSRLYFCRRFMKQSKR